MDDLLRLQYPKPGGKLDPDALPFEAGLVPEGSCLESR